MNQLLTIEKKLDTKPANGAISGRLKLPFEERQKSRLRARLESGEEVGLFLPPGTILRGGDLLLANDGRVIEVVAEPEKVLQVECATPRALAAAAYHLGNRHVHLQIGESWLRIAEDEVLKQMLLGVGAKVTALIAPFEPEAGAYGTHQHSGAAAHGGVIHQFGHGHEH